MPNAVFGIRGGALLDSYSRNEAIMSSPVSGKMQPMIVRRRELANIDLYHQVKRPVRYAYQKRELVPCMSIDTGVTPPGQVVSFLLVSNPSVLSGASKCHRRCGSELAFSFLLIDVAADVATVQLSLNGRAVMARRDPGCFFR